MTGDDDLDQIFTAAMAAVTFTIAHWDQFQAWVTAALGHPAPMTRHYMRDAGIRVAEMVDPARLKD